MIDRGNFGDVCPSPAGEEEAQCRRAGFCGRACLSREISNRLCNAGLRPTRQRLELARILFAGGHHHFTADMLHEEALRKGISVSLATVYNTLQQFTSAGLLRRLSIDCQRSWFDTDLTEHHHLFCEQDGEIVDVPRGDLTISRLPPVPEGMAIDRVEVVVRLRRCQS